MGVAGQIEQLRFLEVGGKALELANLDFVDALGGFDFDENRRCVRSIQDEVDLASLARTQIREPVVVTEILVGAVDLQDDPMLESLAEGGGPGCEPRVQAPL